jgi:hypothetical protein
MAMLVGTAALSHPAAATTTLTVDLSSTIRPVTHAAAGSLYGVIERLPGDVNSLIAPLHPSVLTNPAAVGSDKQQPVGDAIVVAGRVAAIGTKVTIRLADWFPGWYSFTNMNDWFDKIGQTASRKQASGQGNYYGYEIWNEPDGTWHNSMTFNDFWKQTYAKLRQLDPTAKLIGPSLSSFNSASLKDFLSFAKSNDCLPDIVCWHELSGADLTANFQSYRALEKQLGIDPLPITINEYSGKAMLDDEGKPGASAPMVAKFERFQVDSACISYWDDAHPGRLGSLLANDTATNGGWWFYKWYGDMRGTMVSTSPPSANDPTALDGFANLDVAATTASVLFGGVNDGTVQVIVKGFKSASLGSTVHAVVEHTPWKSRTTVVTATDTVSSSDLPVTSDQIAVMVSGTNNTDGYRLLLTSFDAGTGGATGAGGNRGTGGSVGADAAADSGLGGGGGGGGTSGAGGTGSSGGGGAVASGGAASSGGAVANGGAGNGGATESGGGRTASGGSKSSGGNADTSTAPSPGGSTGTPKSSSSSGCSCGVGHGSDRSGHSDHALPTMLVLLAWALCRRRARAVPV